MSDYLVQQVGITGPAGRIGAGTGYHIDSKYNKSMSWEDIVKAFDAKAKAYAEDKRNIVFSNKGMNYAVYDPNADIQTKLELLQRASRAHKQKEGFYSFDYYAPVGIDVWDKSSEGAPIYLAGQPGEQAFGGTADDYGNFGYTLDDFDNVLSKSGHGDTSFAAFRGAMFPSEGLEFVVPQDNYERVSMPHLEAKQRAMNYQDMTKAQLDAEYDRLRGTDMNTAALEGMKMHNAYFGKI